jgi:SAM-dependent methyltransferase
MTTHAPVAAGSLPLTGERTVPGVPSENYWFRRHEVAYLHLLDLVDGGLLVEVGAGEGYGSSMFAARAEHVVALDYDALAAAHVVANYAEVSAVRGNLAALPIATGIADTVASLQVIEHVWDHPQFVRECARIARPGGALFVTTPNRLTFSPGLDKPVNPFHTHEFIASELSRLVGRNGFDVSAVRGLCNGPRLVELDQRYASVGGFVAAQLASPPDAWSDDLAADVASIGPDDFVITDVANDDCLDLVLLARRP